MSKKSKSDVILRVEGLSKSFSEGKLSVDVFSDVTFQVHRSEMVGTVGSSGAGKSSLLHLLGGLDTPTAGQVFIEDTDIHSLSEKQKGQLRNKLLGFIYQFHHLLPEFTALENVSLPMLISGLNMEEANEKSSRLLKKVNLENRMDHKPSELSGGERQRVAVARSLSNSPSCLIMDEPTGDLDAYNALKVSNTIFELSDEFNISFTSL